MLKQPEARHRLHAPVGDDEGLFDGPCFLEGSLSVAGFVHVLVANLFESLADDAQHGFDVVYDEYLLRSIACGLLGLRKGEREWCASLQIVRRWADCLVLRLMQPQVVDEG